jgi:hypothetical protein
MVSNSCFSGCESLDTVIFAAGSVLRKIGECAFALSGLKMRFIPASVEVIGKAAFRACKWLSSVTFEAGSVLLEIGESLFAESRLKSVVIPGK